MGLTMWEWGQGCSPDRHGAHHVGVGSGMQSRQEWGSPCRSGVRDGVRDAVQTGMGSRVAHHMRVGSGMGGGDKSPHRDGVTKWGKGSGMDPSRHGLAGVES